MSSGAGASAVAGWYRDPSGRYRERYWDGAAWTGHVRGELGGARARTELVADPRLHELDTMEIPAVAAPRGATPAGVERSNAISSRWGPAVLACVYGGAVGIGVGSVLVWVKASAGELSSSERGIEGDGVITLVLAIVAVIGFTLLTSHRAAAILALSAGAVAGLVAAYDLVDLSSKTGDLPTGVDVSTKPGLGLLLTGLAAVAMTVGGALALDEAERVARDEADPPVTGRGR